MKTLVTGANGFIGANLVRELLAGGCDVRALVRRNSDLRSLAGLPVELVYGDILEPESLTAAVQGCDVLYHTAAVFAYWGVSANELDRIAVQGTQNVLAAARQGGVRRVILTSSSVVFGSSTRPILRDESFDQHDKDAPPYVTAKSAQEVAAFRTAAELGLELVAVCPAIVVGPHDYHLSPSNGIIVAYLNDPYKLTFPGGCNIVSAADVARGHILAATAGHPGERYFLGSENLEWSAIHRAISQLCGISGPNLSTNHTGSYLAAATAELQAWLTHQPPLTTRAQAKMVGRYYWYSGDKSAALGYAPKPARQALAEALAWLVASPHISQAVRVTLQLSREVHIARQEMAQHEARTGAPV